MAFMYTLFGILAAATIFNPTALGLNFGQTGSYQANQAFGGNGGIPGLGGLVSSLGAGALNGRITGVGASQIGFGGPQIGFGAAAPGVSFPSYGIGYGYPAVASPVFASQQVQHIPITTSQIQHLPIATTQQVHVPVVNTHTASYHPYPFYRYKQPLIGIDDMTVYNINAPLYNQEPGYYYHHSPSYHTYPVYHSYPRVQYPLRTVLQTQTTHHTVAPTYYGYGHGYGHGYGGYGYGYGYPYGGYGNHYGYGGYGHNFGYGYPYYGHSHGYPFHY